MPISSGIGLRSVAFPSENKERDCAVTVDFVL